MTSTDLSLPQPRGAVGSTLAANRLGVSSILGFNLTAAAPLTVAAGLITTGYAVGVTAIPAAFLVGAVVLVIFSVGYVAMARHVANAGAFYAYVTRGLGRPAGVAAALVALLAYNAMQVGLYGGVGAAAGPLLQQWFDLDLSWWLIALFAWAVTAVLGLLRVDVNGRVLAVLLVAEILVICVYDASDLGHVARAGGHISLSAFSPTNLAGATGAGAALVLAITGFVGFESAVVFAEESKDPRRTVPRATYLSLGIIAVLYAASAWAPTLPIGQHHIVDVSRQQGPEVIFTLAHQYLGKTAADVGHALFVTGVIAAMISYHNTIARYAFALGRERVLPPMFARTSRLTEAPWVASLMQSLLGLGVIVVFAQAGWDPLTKLFFLGGTGGGFGILLLLTATSAAVVAFFHRRPLPDENAWQRLIAPLLSFVLLAGVVVLAVHNIGTLLGDPHSRLRWVLLAAYPTVAVIGTVAALVIRYYRNDVYATIGMGADSLTGRGVVDQGGGHVHASTRPDLWD
ncbi:MAG: APC family permease [Mycobacteriales bacterium]